MRCDVSPEQRLFNLVRSGARSLERKEFDFPRVNGILGAVFFVSILLLVGMFFLLSRVVRSEPLLPSLPPLAVMPAAVTQAYAPLDDYLDTVSARDIFLPASAATPAGTQPAEGAARDLILSGIYMGQQPQAIIQDKTSGKVYFLGEGDRVGGYTVKRILADKVILQRGTRELELL